MLLVVILPFLGLIAGIILFWGRGFSWIQLGLFLGMYLLSGLGITAGYHRLFTHRAFETIWPIKWALGVLGSMAVEGPLFKWVATHRMHHRHSDSQDDPHSPHAHGPGLRAMARGFWHAHVGWTLGSDSPSLLRYVGDLITDPHCRMISKLFPVWAILGVLIPAVLGGLLTGTWFGALMGFIWGGLARLFFIQHVTFSINSVCHVWGRRPFRTQDQSRNNIVFGVLGMGEGWHNNHHAFPTSARHGLRWWQMDLTYMLICGLKTVGLAWNVRLPSENAIAAKLLEENVASLPDRSMRLRIPVESGSHVDRGIESCAMTAAGYESASSS
jgi:stearoyl-CoA desaturase (delta-9 desaturase)